MAPDEIANRFSRAFPDATFEVRQPDIDDDYHYEINVSSGRFHRDGGLVQEPAGPHLMRAFFAAFPGREDGLRIRNVARGLGVLDARSVRLVRVARKRRQRPSPAETSR